MQNHFSLQLKSRWMISPSVLHLEFIPSEGIDFVPGQFITFHFELDGQAYSRSYSIGSIPTETCSIEIAVSPYQGGPGTRKLFSLQVGECIETSGPFGRLILREEAISRYILIATGTGVTPYRAMLPSLIERICSENIQVDILLGVKSREEALYSKDFCRYAEQTSALRFHAFYSRQFPEDAQAFEHRGHVQSSFDSLHLDPQRDVVYLCGNPNMIDEAFAKLRERGFETARVRREKYISPKK